MAQVNLPTDVTSGRFDFGVALRPTPTGTADQLSVIDRNLAAHLVNRMAFVTKPDLSSMQVEETELQRKAQLTRLSSPNVIDREFNQWPQVSQGDFSGGTYQRVFEVADRYWDNQGLIWPLSEAIPAKPYQPVVRSFEGAPLAGPFNIQAIAGGFVTGLPSPGFAVGYRNPAAGGHSILAFFQNGSVGRITDPVNFGYATTMADMALLLAHGVLWYATQQSGTGSSLNYVTFSGGGIATQLAILDATFSASGTIPGLAAALIGNQQYVAVVINAGFASTAPAGIPQQSLFLYNVTPGALNPAGFVGNAFIRYNLPLGQQVSDIAFQGSNLLISMTDGANSTILSYSVTAQSWSTIATLPGLNRVFLGVVGAAVLLLGSLRDAAGNTTVDLYLLSGSSLEHIGLPTVQPMFRGVTKPGVYGPYVIFGVAISNSTIIFYAYDVIRGRWFRLPNLDSAGANFGANLDRYPVAVTSGIRATSPTASAQWGYAVNVNQSDSPNNNIQEFYFGSLGADITQPIQRGFDVTSSLIDFTSANNKLFRQVLVSHEAIPAGSSVTIQVWLDKDPQTAAKVAPDIAGTANSTLGSTQTGLFINQIARKLVYRVFTTDPAFPSPTTRITSVAIQAAVGWVWTFFVELGPEARLGTKGQGYAYESQDDTANQALDHVAAYNFLRSIWRQRGGRCILYAPNGDSFNALMQSASFESPKVLAPQVRSDTPTSLRGVMQVKFAEDV